MKFNLLCAFSCIFMLQLTCFAADKPVKSKSYYQQKPEDADAVYFTPATFKITNDGKTDVSNELQDAINQIKVKQNFGILFIPEGKYLISKTIYIPPAIRLIGYGKNRPQIILKKNAPGYQQESTEDKGKANYMIWFTNAIVKPGQPIRDANASTFYSALSNIDMVIEDGNPYAVALRAHYAQHSFITHADIHIGNGKAGLFDVGNELEDVRFFGGDYGIYTTKPAPGWQFMMVDTYFEGQRKAAIKTQEAGLTIVRLEAKNVPVVIDIDSNYYEKLFMEDCRFDHISGPAIRIGREGNAYNQITLKNIDCQSVPVLASYKISGSKTAGKGAVYHVNTFVYGTQIDGLTASPVFKTTYDAVPLKSFPAMHAKDIPDLPEMKTWANLRTLGAKGDGITDDTKIIQDAIDKYPTVYVPQGWYKVSSTIKLKSNTTLIGLNPVATQFILADNTEKFGGFGGPQPLLETPQGGTNILTGIGLNTGAYNNRAVGCKWMAGEHSYLNDVKFIGGHGTMEHPSNQPRHREEQQDSRILPGMDMAWDTQYWSLWITNGGGGTFKDIWSASSYAVNGVYVSNTSTPGRVYALSVEHHVRNEVRFNKVSNWKVYALQLEEENREGSDAQPLEIQDCSDMVFANLYMYRVTRVNVPFPSAVRTWNCRNIDIYNLHNFAQTRYIATSSIYDVNTNIEVRPWEFNWLHIGNDAPASQFAPTGYPGVTQLAKGFEFADGICRDSKGNIYFSETRLKRIYKWSAQSKTVSLLADFPWNPLALACDKNDNLLVVFKYFTRDGYLVNGKPEQVTILSNDASNTGYSIWGNSGFATRVLAIDPEHPDESIAALNKVPATSISKIEQVFYPANRAKGFYGNEKGEIAPDKEVFVAPDGVSIIPLTFDLSRANSLQGMTPGTEVYAVEEYNKRVVKISVAADGTLSNVKPFAEQGEYSLAVDAATNNVYVADGQLYVFDKAGKQINEIKLPERPVTMLLDGKTMFFTSRAGLYTISMP